MTIMRIIGTVNAKRVKRSGTGRAHRNQPMPNISGTRRQIVARSFRAARRVVKTHLDTGGVAGEQCEVDAVFAPCRTQRPRRTWSCVQITGLTDQIRSAYSRTLRSLEK